MRTAACHASAEAKAESEKKQWKRSAARKHTMRVQA
jgi:hypothetical protein